VLTPGETGAAASSVRFRRELNRKAIHVGSIVLPLFAWFASRPVALVVLVTIATLAAAAELLRLEIRSLRFHFLTRTKRLLRPHERHRFSGAGYLAVAYAAALVIFPKNIAVLSMLYGGLGDSLAAIVGRRFGRSRLRSGKSLEGATTLFAIALLAGLVVPGISLVATLAGAITVTALELADLPPDDNLWITLGGGAVVWMIVTWS
jgi:dolichol kinase